MDRDFDDRIQFFVTHVNRSLVFGDGIGASPRSLTLGTLPTDLSMRKFARGATNGAKVSKSFRAK